MNYFNLLLDRIKADLEGLQAAGILPAGLDFAAVALDPPKDPKHGDVSTNAAMVLAKAAGKPPREIATALAARLRSYSDTDGAEVAGPGFLNLRLKPSFWYARLSEALNAGDEYGRSTLGRGKGAVNVEYVSANPTGPMHVGHARGAVFGDALAALLEFTGHDVTREYYINDDGAQVDVLARSAYLRYREALGDRIGEIPSGLYPGEYLKDVGEGLVELYKQRFHNAPESEWMEPFREFAVAEMMGEIRDDLELLGVRHDVFTSERGLVAEGKVDKSLGGLRRKGLVYEGVLEPPKGKEPEDWEPRQQTLFKATQFGDDTDRPVQKSDGSWTYFATDIAYHADKIDRGFETLINVWGADHGGYVKRMEAAVKALSDGKVALDVQLCQLVKLMDRGQPVKMSKRAGTFVTLRDVVDAVGKDVVRFIMLTRRNDAQLEFDYAVVTEESKENPVFYVQYAHARCHSVLRKALEVMPGVDLSSSSLARVELQRLTHPDELALIKVLASWPRSVESAAEAHEPHRVAFWLRDLAAAFHALWNRGKEEEALRFLVDGDRSLTLARMALVRGCALGLAVGLRIMGVTPVEELR
ncbi:MAG: arginine--tRNA ligase [Alphaproteobacteria bacterium]|nr:arginine--tRNA ligase [Alphaproteobacteria bacterium]